MPLGGYRGSYKGAQHAPGRSHAMYHQWKLRQKFYISPPHLFNNFTVFNILECF